MIASEAYHKARWENKRSLELEPIIMQEPFYAYCYATDIIRGRWYEAEPVIMQDAINAYRYSRDVIQGRWLEAEEIIAQCEYNVDYIDMFFGEPVVTKEQVDIIQWERMNLPGYFAPASLFEDKLSLLDMVVEE